MGLFALESLGSSLVELLWEATAVGLGVILAFSIALTATIRAGEARTGGRHVAVVSWSALAVLGYVAFMGCAVLAIHVVTNK